MEVIGPKLLIPPLVTMITRDLNSAEGDRSRVAPATQNCDRDLRAQDSQWTLADRSIRSSNAQGRCATVLSKMSKWDTSFASDEFAPVDSDLHSVQSDAMYNAAAAYGT